VANLNLSIWNVLMAPKGTPRAVVDRLNVALRKAAGEPNVRASLAKVAVEPPDEARMSPEVTQAFVKSEVERWVPALKKAGIKPVD
jgi:tripartite-type tricarboxylate transporter receptor subunit TctC